MSTTPTKISLILPIYNMEKYLPYCLNSIITQTLKEMEIICVNDGSVDASLSILETYAKKDKRIQIITQHNQGAAIARNNGLKVAKGEFIAFMDPDDFYPNNQVLELMYQKARDNNALICGGGLYLLKKEKLVTEPCLLDTGYTFNKEGFMAYQTYQFDYGFCRFLYQRQFIEANELYFPPYSRGEDPVFFIKAMCLAKRFYALPTATYVYRVGYKKTIWTRAKISETLQSLEDCKALCLRYHLDDLLNTVDYRMKKMAKKRPSRQLLWHKLLFWIK